MKYSYCRLKRLVIITLVQDTNFVSLCTDFYFLKLTSHLIVHSSSFFVNFKRKDPVL